MIRDARKLGMINEELDKISSLTGRIDDQLKDKLQTLKKRAQAKLYSENVKQQQAQMEKLRKEKLQRAYADYLAQRSTNEANDPSNVSDEVKVSLMRQMLSMELGEEFINSSDSNTETSFPAFYALDLIQFGIKRDIPGAIRLGEILLAENCENDPDAKIPQELSRAVRSYLFENQERYRNTIKQTGPINNSSMYHLARQEGDAKVPIIFCADDPYFQDLVQKNYRREDSYKLPSKFAWDHKPHGILGEIFNMDVLERKLQENMK